VHALRDRAPSPHSIRSKNGGSAWLKNIAERAAAEARSAICFLMVTEPGSVRQSLRRRVELAFPATVHSTDEHALANSSHRTTRSQARDTYDMLA